MSTCAYCGAALAGERCGGCGAAADPATQAELGHLAFVLNDLGALRGRLHPSAYAVLSVRYEARQRQLLGLRPGAPLPKAAPGPVAGGFAAMPAEPGSLPPPAPPARPVTPPRAPLEPVAVLLGLGAFLVTVASLIFVAYSWAALSGPIKTLLMAGLTAGFLAAGRLALRRPALRPAGQTFTAIGATLTPLTFVAAYNFWLAGAGLGWPALGLAAALASAALYARLAVTLGERLYAWATLAAAGAAVAFGLVWAGVPGAWWAVPAAGVAFGLWRAGERRLAPPWSLFAEPARWLAWLTAGGALLWLLLLTGIAAEDGAADWWPIAAGFAALTLVAAGAAAIRRQAALAGLALFTGSLAVVTGIAGLPAQTGVIVALGAFYSFVGVVLTIMAALALLAAGRTPPPWPLPLRIYAAVVGLLAPWLTIPSLRPAMTAAGLAVALLAGVAWRGRQPAWLWAGALALPAIYGVAAAVLDESTLHWTLLAYLWVIAVGLGALAIRRDRPALLYGTTLLAGVGLVAGLSAPDVPAPAQALGFTGTGWALAGVGLALGARRPAARLRLVEGGVALAAIACPVAIATQIAGRADASLLPLTLALLAGLLGLVAAGLRRLWVAEAATGVAVAALLAQFSAWNRDDIQWYSVPVALWLIGLALLHARRGQIKLANGLGTAGLVALLGPTLVQALVHPEGWRYALLAGVEALVLLAIGLRQRLRLPIGAGVLTLSLIAARQVFDGVRSLPAWAIIGVVGVALLCAALALLLRRDALNRAGAELRGHWQTWR
jgi:hypothetical protein